MTQVLPAALVAPTKPGLTVGYLIRANSGTVSTAFTTSGVSEQGTSTGYYRVNNGISAPDDGGLLEWYVNNAGAAGTFLSAVAIDPAPNQADQAAGIRAAVGLASANLDGQLSGISNKTTNLPASFPAVDGSGRVTVGTNTDKTGYSLTQAFPTNFSSLAITASTGQVTVGTNTDKTGYSLANSQTFSTTGSVGSVTGAVGSVTNPVTAGTVSDKTGYSLGSSQTFNLTGNITGNLSGSVGSVTGAVGSVTNPVTAGTVSDKTGYSLTQAFPTNFSSLAITASTGQVTVGTNADKTGYSLANSQTFSTTGAVGSVTNPVTAGTVSDKTGYSLGSSQTFNLTGNITGNLSGSVGSVTGAVTVGTLSNNVITANSINAGAITNAKFAAGAIDAAAIATDAITAAKIATDAITDAKIAASAVTEIQSGLASQASVNALPTPATIADAVWDEALSGHLTAGSTGKKLADASTLTVGDIPAGLTAQQVWEYATRALTGTQATNLAAIPSIPTNPLLTNDARLNNLDATISSRSTLTAAQIRTELATELARLDVAVSTRLAAANYTTPPTTAQIATAVEAALLNDADGQALLAAIQAAVQALFDQQADIPVATLVSLIAAQITADHGSGSYTTANLSAVALEATAQAIKAKTDNLPSDPADQSELVTLINTRLAAANYTAPDNTGIAAIKAKTDNLPSDPADQSELVALINTKASQTSVDAIPTTPLLAANYTAPDNTGIAAIKAKTDNLPSDPADQSELVTLINTKASQTSVDALPSAATIADAVWDESLSGHLTAGSTGAKLNLASTLTVGDIPAGLTAAQVWSYATRELTGSQATNLAAIPNIPTNPLLAANYTAPNNAGIASTKGLVEAFTLGRFKIDYAASTATQYNPDGTVRKVFLLQDDQGNPATDPQTAVDRVPQ